ncbi:MAG TPA: hypothetical protein VFI73_10280 [Candidatus Nitrosopolaris sp.]|nr:hypothetical protein [Candidatus Nitrosopolaris sp.]
MTVNKELAGGISKFTQTTTINNQFYGRKIGRWMVEKLGGKVLVPKTKSTGNGSMQFGVDTDRLNEYSV